MNRPKEAEITEEELLAMAEEVIQRVRFAIFSALFSCFYFLLGGGGDRVRAEIATGGGGFHF